MAKKIQRLCRPFYTNFEITILFAQLSDSPAAIFLFLYHIDSLKFNHSIKLCSSGFKQKFKISFEKSVRQRQTSVNDKVKGFLQFSKFRFVFLSRARKLFLLTIVNVTISANQHPCALLHYVMSDFATKMYTPMT